LEVAVVAIVAGFAGFGDAFAANLAEQTLRATSASARAFFMSFPL
jgi:hypothetical protein